MHMANPQEGRDWSKKATKYKNTDDAIWWLRHDYYFLSRGYKHYQVLHGEYAPYLTLEHYILICSVHEEDRRRAANHQLHRDIRHLIASGQVRIRGDWPTIRDNLMWEALCFKFGQEYGKKDNNVLRIQLLNTDRKHIIDTNTGCENYWGTCVCPNCNNPGKNVYGAMLMQIRQLVSEGKV